MSGRSELESVSYAPDRLDVLGISAYIAEFLTDLLDMNRNGGDITYGFHAPDGPEKIILGINLVGILGKE